MERVSAPGVGGRESHRFTIRLDSSPTAIHRLLATLHRKRAGVNELHYVRSDLDYLVNADLSLPLGRLANIVAILKQDVSVIDVEVHGITAEDR